MLKFFMSKDTINKALKSSIQHNVEYALAEDIGSGDITAGLIPENLLAKGKIKSREKAVICGRPWIDELFYQVDSRLQVSWQVTEGQQINPDQVILTVEGNARALLRAERSALNFLQTLSGIATRCNAFSGMVQHTGVRLLDTRKTIPGLRVAQKYAVAQGGCCNHRMGLYDAFLIKENHIAICGGIASAINQARRQLPDKTVELEVESIEELQQALAAEADTIMLDNFSLDDLIKAVEITQGKVKLEASGNITEENLRIIAETGVDFISMGTLTKDCKAIDLTMNISMQ